MGKQKRVKVESEDEYDGNVELTMFDEKNVVDSTHLAPVELDQDTQRLLIDQVRQQLASNSLTEGYAYMKAISKLKWDKIQVDGFTTEKIKEEFEKIIKPVRKIRNLTEVLDELERNPGKYSLDLPKQPPGAMFLYINENREKFVAKKGKLSVPDLSKYGAEKFRKLTDEKRLVYENKAKKLREEYLEKMDHFYERHPEIKRSIKKEKEQPKLDTPFNLFVSSRQAESEAHLNREELRNEWKILPLNEKAEFIKAVLMGPEDGRKKMISKEEKKLLDQANGMPERPLTAFTMFVKEYNKKHPGESDLFKQAASSWATMTDEEKSPYIKIQNKSYQVYKVRAEEYISKLPLHEQLTARKSMQISQSKKRKASSTPTSDANGRKIKEESEDGDDVLKIKEDSDNDDDYESEPQPFKKFKSELIEEKATTSKGKAPSISPSKKATKVPLPEPEIPINRVELYFMKHVHKGPESELKQAFDNLAPKKREKYSKIVDDTRREFMENLQNYINSIDKTEQAKFRAKVQRVFKEQDEQISWSKVKEESSDDGSSSDESSSSDSD